MFAAIQAMILLIQKHPPVKAYFSYLPCHFIDYCKELSQTLVVWN